MKKKPTILTVLVLFIGIIVWSLLSNVFEDVTEQRYKVTDLGEAMFTGFTHTLDINNHGEILIYFVNPDQNPITFIRSPTGATQEFDVSVGRIPGFLPVGFNDFGDVLGEVSSATGRVRTAVYEPASGILRSLGVFGGPNGYATSLNNREEVVGLSMQNSSGYVWSASTSTVIVPNATGVMMAAFYGINDHGEIVGYQVTSKGYHYPILRSPTGDSVELGSFGHGLSAAMGINNKRQVVGYSGIENRMVRPVVNLIDGIFSSFSKVKAHRPDRSHAFLWEDGVLKHLNDLIPEDSDWELIQALDINDQGEIVGWGEYGGKEHAYLLTPIRNDEDD